MVKTRVSVAHIASVAKRLLQPSPATCIYYLREELEPGLGVGRRHVVGAKSRFAVRPVRHAFRQAVARGLQAFQERGGAAGGPQRNDVALVLMT